MADNNYYLAPAPFPFNPSNQDKYGEKVFGWSQDFIQQGSAYLKLQPAYPYIQDGIDLINGVNDPAAAATLSSAKTESVVRNMKELIAAQTNLRIIPSFKSESNIFLPTAALLNKMYLSWQGMTFADREIRKAWQYAAGGGTGYLSIGWNPNYWSRGKGELELTAHGPLDVIPVGIPDSHNIQAAYGVAIKVCTPWHELVRKFPEYRDKINPDGQGDMMGPGSVIQQSIRTASAALRRYLPGSTGDQQNKPWETVDTYYFYLDDDSVNNTGRPILMGDPGTSWEYTVPYIGQDIPKGHDGMGRMRWEHATAKDCLLYPNKRRIICTNTGCLTPDPTQQVNPYWHGKTPVVQWRADDWAWSFLGFPLSKAGSSLEKANIQMLRALVDSYNVMMSPPRAYNRNTMSSALAQAINPRLPNQMVGLDLTFSGDNQLKPLMPAEYYRIPGDAVRTFLESNEARIKQQMGVADAAAMARARQLPSGDSLEKILDSLGPIVKDQSRNMERSVTELGDMWKFGAFQFYTANRRMSQFGEAGLVAEDWDYKPGELVPDSLPGMDGSSRFDVARVHAIQFPFSVAPYSLHEFNSTSRKLLFLQLSRFGFPISWWTMAELYDVKNFGDKPIMTDPVTGAQRECQTELELWISQKEIEIRMQMAAQPPSPNGEPTQGSGPGQGHGGGRPPTAQQLPSIAQKADGRPIIRESSK